MYSPTNRNPSNVTLSLAGMYEYDNTIFDDIVIPEGIDKPNLIMTILGSCGGNEVRYPNAPILKTMIDNFFYTNAYKFSELWKTTQFEYDPLVNYDLEITEHREETHSDKVENSVVSSQSNENKVSAFDSNVYSPESSQTGSGNSSSDETREGGNQYDYTRTERGDNSARSTQYMIQEQREVVDFNLYRIIANLFEDEITIPVYSRSKMNVNWNQIAGGM